MTHRPDARLLDSITPRSLWSVLINGRPDVESAFRKVNAMMHSMEIWMSALLGLAMIGLLVWLIVRSVTSPPPSRSGDKTNAALEILRRRLAAGEIDAYEL